MSMGSLLQPIDLLLYRTRPVAKVEGISTEAVMTRVSAINDPDAQTRADAERLLSSFFQGLLARSQGSNPPLPSELAMELELYIRSNISSPRMLSTLFPRGYFAVIDPNRWSVENPLVTKTAAAILGLRWSRVARHDYVNFEDQTAAHVTGSDLICNDGDFSGLTSFVADGAKLIADIESLDGSLPVGTRWGIIASLNGSASTIVLSGQVTATRALAVVHPGAHFTTSGDGSLILDPPIPLIDQAQLLGSILAIDILPDAEVGETEIGTSEIATLRNVGFSVVKSKDLQNDTLVSLSSPVWPKAAPNSVSSGWLRIAKCGSKVISVQSYMKPTEVDGNVTSQNLVSLLEQDREENVCFFGRIVSSGSKATNASLGPVSPMVFRLPSSISPQIPVIKTFEARPWNISVQWVSKTVSGMPVYNDDTEFQVGLECIELGTEENPLLHGGADLATILSRMVSGGWPNDDDEWGTVADWLANRTPPRSAIGTPPRFSDPTPKTFSNVGAGSFLVSPSGAAGQSLDWTGQEADILRWRRENFLWRVRLRAVTNPKDKDFSIFSDWTLPAGPIAALPLVPRIIRPTSPVATTTYSRPTITILVNYATQYRQPSDFSTLSYQLVVRKYLIVPDPKNRTPGDHNTAPCSERVVQPSPPQPMGSQYLWQFQFIDREIAPHEEYADNLSYTYELELQQLRILAGSPFVVTKSEICTLLPVNPNTTVTVTANEPNYD
jgi:hypothetical protein